jgi:hypothetical protein
VACLAMTDGSGSVGRCVSTTELRRGTSGDDGPKRFDWLVCFDNNGIESHDVVLVVSGGVVDNHNMIRTGRQVANVRYNTVLLVITCGVGP